MKVWVPRFAEAGACTVMEEVVEVHGSSGNTQAFSALGPVPATCKGLCDALHWNGLYVYSQVPCSWQMGGLSFMLSDHLWVAAPGFVWHGGGG